MQTLKFGSTGPFTEMLQLALSRAGYELKKDGIFGRATENAVRRFQSASSLVSDGIVGTRTWSALQPYLTGYLTHVTVPGDTFYRLAQRYATTVRAIEIANPSVVPTRLPIGRRLNIPLGFPVVPTDIRFTYELLTYCVSGLTRRYPFLKSGSIGRSVSGRQIPYLTLGGGTRQVFINAAHHANEWINVPLIMKYIEDYCAAFAYGRTVFGVSAAAVYSASALFAVPMVNPDGVELVTGALLPSSEEYKSAKLIAADYPAIPFPAGWKANIAGTDNNLNYPAGWENAKEIKYAQGYVSPAPRDFVGTSALSSPESRAMYNFTRAHDFALTLSYHSQGNVIYWKYLDYEPEESYALALRFGEVSGYEVSTTPYSSGFAGYKDWFIQDYNRPGYTIETGSGENPLPLSQFESIYGANVGILTLALLPEG